MSLILNAKIQLKTGHGDPSTHLDLAEPGFDLDNKKFYIGTGIGLNPVRVLMDTDVSTLNVKYIDFVATSSEPPVQKEGRMHYNEDAEALEFNLDNSVSIFLGKQIYLRVFNDSGVDIPFGKAVTISGQHEAFPTIEMTIGSEDFNLNSTILFTYQLIHDGEFGFALSAGEMYGVDTSSFTPGTPIYLSDTVLGGIVDTPATYRTIKLGRTIASDISNGKILINTILKPNSGFLHWNESLNSVDPYSSMSLAEGSDLANGAKGKMFRGNETLNSSTFILNYNGKFISYDLNAQSTLYFGTDSSVYIYADASYNLVFVDPNVGVWALKDLIGSFATYQYVDGSLATRDILIGNKLNKAGDAMSGNLTVNASIVSDSIIKSGGLPSEFLKADGTVDSTNYRALFNAMSTGLLNGGVLSFVTNTSTYSISAGNGYVVDNHTDPLHPEIIDVSWNALTNLYPGNLTIKPATHVSLDANGNIVESDSLPLATARRTNIYLGAVVHANNSIINVVNNQPVSSLDTGAQLQDLMYAFGFKSLSGNLISHYDSDLRIQKSEGEIFKPGVNFQTSNTQPNQLTVPAQTPAIFRYRSQLSLEEGDVQYIDPAHWDDGGVLTDISGNFKATSQRIYIFPSGLIRIQRGQYVYANLTEAISKYNSNDFIIEPNIGNNSLYLGSLAIIKSATDLSNPLHAAFIDRDGTFASDTQLMSSLQQAYNISFPPEIQTNSELGPLIIKRGTTLDTDIVFGIQSGAGDVKFSVSGNGIVEVAGAKFMDGSVNFNNKRIAGIADPLDTSDGVNKNYADITYAGKTYTDSSLSSRDSSIDWLKNNKLEGSGVSNEVAYWDSTMSLTGNTEFIYDAIDNHLSIGSSSIDPSATLLIDNGVTNHNTVIRAHGNIDSFLQTEIKNSNTGPSSSADVVAAADIFNEMNYIDMGMNNSQYGAPDSLPLDGYLLMSTDPSLGLSGNLLIGNATPKKNIIFFTGSNINAYTNEKLRITGDGSIFIGKPVSNSHLLEVNGDINIPTGAKYLRNGVSLDATYASLLYTDGSLNKRDNRLNTLDISVQTLYSNKYLRESSLGTDFWFNGTVVDLSTSFKNKVANSASTGYLPFNFKDEVLHTNFLRTLVPQNGLIVFNGTNGSTAILDTSINIPGNVTLTGPFSGTMPETFQKIFQSTTNLALKTANRLAEVGNTGVTQIPATLDSDASQGLWMPWGTVIWDPSGNSSLISWNNWIIAFSNDQVIKRVSFTLDVSSFAPGIYSIYVNNATSTPALEYSNVLNRISYTTKAFLGYIQVLNHKINYWHSLPDLNGTPIFTRDKNSYGLFEISGMHVLANADASTLAVTSGQFLLEGISYTATDYFTDTFLGPQNIAYRNPISKAQIVEVDPSNGYIDEAFGKYTNVLSTKNRYYEASTNTIKTYTGPERFIVSELSFIDSDRDYILVRRGGVLYTTILEAIANIGIFGNTACPISNIVSQVHPQIGYFVIATDCSTLLDANLFSIQETVRTGSVSGAGGGALSDAITNGVNIGVGSGVYASIIDNIMQLKSIAPGVTNSIKITSSADSVIIDASIKNWDSSISDLYSSKTNKTYSTVQDGSITRLDGSVAYLFSLPFTTFTYVDGSFATNASVNNAIKVYATNSSVGIALQPYATNSSVGISLYPFATNSSVGISLQPFATNTSVGLAISPLASKFYVDGSFNKRDLSINQLAIDDALKATTIYVDSSLSLRDISIAWLANNKANSTDLNPLATNSSVGIALLSYATNASIGIADFGKNASFNLYATNASIGLANFVNTTTLLSYATNSSVNSAFTVYATNASVNSAITLRDTSIAWLNSNKVNKAGDTMTGTLNINASLNVLNDASFSSSIFVHGLTASVIDDSLRVKGDISVGGSVRVGNDSSIGENLPYAQLDISNGKKIVTAGNYYGQEFHYYQNLATVQTTAVDPTFQSDASLSAAFSGGTYEIMYSCGINKNVTNSDVETRLMVDGSILGSIQNHELSDGATWLYVTRRMFATLAKGTHRIDLQFSQEAAGTTNIRDANVSIFRVL